MERFVCQHFIPDRPDGMVNTTTLSGQGQNVDRKAAGTQNFQFSIRKVPCASYVDSLAENAVSVKKTKLFRRDIVVLCRKI
jgi:hypothetical protein